MAGETDKQPEDVELVELMPLMSIGWALARLVEAWNDNVDFVRLFDEC